MKSRTQTGYKVSASASMAASAGFQERLPARANAAGAEQAEPERGVDLDVDRGAGKRLGQDLGGLGQKVDQYHDAAAVLFLAGLETAH